MLHQNNYENWDFDTIWGIEEGVDFPILKAIEGITIMKYKTDTTNEDIMREIDNMFLLKLVNRYGEDNGIYLNAKISEVLSLIDQSELMKRIELLFGLKQEFSEKLYKMNEYIKEMWDHIAKKAIDFEPSISKKIYMGLDLKKAKEDSDDVILETIITDKKFIALDTKKKIQFLLLWNKGNLISDKDCDIIFDLYRKEENIATNRIEKRDMFRCILQSTACPEYIEELEEKIENTEYYSLDNNEYYAINHNGDKTNVSLFDRDGSAMQEDELSFYPSDKEDNMNERDINILKKYFSEDSIDEIHRQLVEKFNIYQKIIER